jgi:hypothetical protein
MANARFETAAIIWLFCGGVHSRWGPFPLGCVPNGDAMSTLKAG